MSNVANPPPSSARGLPLSTEYEPPVIRKAFESIDTSIAEMQTAFIQLSPAFFAALQRIAPKKRRGQVRYVIVAAVLVVVAGIFADGSTRPFVVERAHALVLKARAAMGGRHQPAASAVPPTPTTKDAPQPNALLPIRPPVVAGPPVAPIAAPVASPVVTSAAPVAKPITPAAPEAKPTKDARSPAAGPKRSPRKSTRAPRPAPPQTASAPAGMLASRDTDGF